jgi:hypothetical protein
MDRKISNRIFMLLIAIYVVVSFLSVFVPPEKMGVSVPLPPMPAPLPVVALASAGIALVFYGGLGTLGLLLSRKLGLPEIWDASVSNRKRFLIPGLVGLGSAIVIIIGDQLFAPINGIGHFPHPPFPISVLATIAAGIGEEIMFRLFFICFWTWLVSRVILRGRWQEQIFGVFSFMAAIAFGMAHLPSIMFLNGWTSMEQVPSMLVVEMVLLNGVLGLLAAYYFRKAGFLAAVGIHFWADIFWHVLWGAAATLAYAQMLA